MQGVSRAALVGLLASLALARPARAGDDKAEAKALLASGLKSYAAKDYVGALAIFRDAYARFPSAKIQLNIATTLAKLDRKAEAANAYQKYLDADDADAAKKPDVEKVLAELDKAVATLQITATPTATEIEIGDEDYVKDLTRYRVAPGSTKVRARHEGYAPVEIAVTGTAGTVTPVAIALVAIPKAIAPPVPVVTIVKPAPPAERSRFGALVLAHVDVPNRGAAALVGATADLDRVELQAAALIGGTAGGYLGASVAILTGRVRPLLSAGMPVFVSHGARFAVRGAAGVELLIDRHISIIAEVGVEHVFSPEMNVVPNLFIPALGVAGRL